VEAVLLLDIGIAVNQVVHGLQMQVMEMKQENALLA